MDSSSSFQLMERGIDAEVGLDTRELFMFIKETQRPERKKLVKAHGGDITQRAHSTCCTRALPLAGVYLAMRRGVRAVWSTPS